MILSSHADKFISLALLLAVSTGPPVLAKSTGADSVKPPAGTLKMDSTIGPGVGAKPAPETEDTISEAVLLSSPKLTSLWSKVNLVGTSDLLGLKFKLQRLGDSYYLDSPTDIVVYNTSGSDSLDDFARECLRKAGAFDLKSLGKRPIKDSGDYLAIFSVRQKLVIITTLAKFDADFSPYMAQLQRLIKRAWFPPKSDKSVSVKFAFTVHSNGTVGDIKSLTPLASQPVIQAAENAITCAAPFPALPPGSPNIVTIEFTFDYNVSKGGGVFRTIANDSHSSLLTSYETDSPTSVRSEIVGLFAQPAKNENEGAPFIDLTPYLEKTARKIQGAWHPPHGSESTKEMVTFDINKDGSISSLCLGNVTGDNNADRAVLEAANNAAPYAPLPLGAGYKVRAELKICADPWGNANSAPVFDLQALTGLSAQTTDHPPIPNQANCQRLSRLWSKPSLKEARKDLAFMVDLNAKGRLVCTEGRPNIVVYNSSRNQSLDDFAEQCIRRSAPFDLSVFNNRAGNYLVKFDASKKTALITTVPDIDWRPYMANLNRALRRRWSPPISDTGNLSVFSCKLNAHGRVSGLRLVTADTKPVYEQVGRWALSDASPFGDFPAGAPDEIDLQCTFDYAPIGKEAIAALETPAGTVLKPPGPADAIREYDKASDAEAVASVHEKLADVYRIRLEDDEAISEYKAAMRLRDTACLEVKLGQAYQSKGDMENANACYARARKIFPDLPFVWGVLSEISPGPTWKRAARPSWGISWEKAIANTPATVGKRLDFAIQQQFDGHYHQAGAELDVIRQLSPGQQNLVAEKLLQLLPTSAAQARTYLFINLGEYEYAQRRYDASLNAYIKAQKYVPPDEKKQQASILTGIGVVYQAVEDWTSAIKSFEKALSLDSSNHEAAAGLKSSQSQLKK